MAGKIEEDYAASFVEQARQCLREGDYSKALALLGRAERLRPSFTGISELVAISEVCQAAAWRCLCRLQAPKPKNPDWYRVLKVDESADGTSIRKRYRQLALLLHPDKNKNVKAEEAFKLVSEAYACLSDKNLRKNFNIDRSKFYCARCYSAEEPLSKRRTDDRSYRHSQSDHWKSEQERLQMFKERARARVTSLTQDIRTRRSRWNADLESAREKYQNKRVDRKSVFSEDILERPIRESDVFQPGRRFHVAADSDLMSILRGRRTSSSSQHREKTVSQSLDGLLSRLKRDSKEEAERFFSGTRKQASVGEVTPEPSKLHEGFAFTEGRHLNHLRRDFVADNEPAAQSCDVTNRIFSKRVSSAAETLPARKLFKEDDSVEFINSDPQAFSSQLNAQADLRRQSFATTETTSCISDHKKVASSSSGAAAAAEMQPQTPPAQKNIWKGSNLRGNVVVGHESSSGIRTEYAETTTPFCCGSSRKSVLKEQRQKSEELLKTLERLRQEAKSVAATLDKLKRRVDSSTDIAEEVLVNSASSSRPIAA